MHVRVLVFELDVVHERALDIEHEIKHELGCSAHRVHMPARGAELRHAGDARGHQAQEAGDEQPDGLAGRQEPAHTGVS